MSDWTEDDDDRVDLEERFDRGFYERDEDVEYSHGFSEMESFNGDGEAW